MPINSTVALCGIRTRQLPHRPCTQPAMKNKKRCRMHGGKCTGPKTPEGKIKSAQANYKHGLYTKEAIMERKFMQDMMQWKKDLKGYKEN